MTDDTQHLLGLNKEQREAAEHINGPLLIVAGAGAGKTKTITHKIVNLIKNGVSPEHILAVTFTNKAAKEMRDRIIAEIEKNAKGQERIPFVSTFHSLGVFIIKENARILGLTKYFTILDENDAKTIIKDILKELNFDPKEHSPGKIKAIISIEKGKFTSLENYRENIKSVFQELVANVWKIYEEKKKKENSLDFDDLLLKATKLLKENKEIRKFYQEKWKYIHIDEYQDTNEVQYLMTKMLAENNKNITVVGDTDQCLIKGTKIKMADGTLKSIENIKRGKFVLSNYGSGDFRPAKVAGKRNLQFRGDLVRIETKKGKILTSTPDHIHFAGYRLGSTPQLYLNYLMYKKNVGWRIGTTSIHTKGQRKSMVGFVQRSNQEHADATWVIGTHQTSNKARVQEYIYSLKYQIPTIPFTPRKGFSINGYVHDKDTLEEIFSSFDTEKSAMKLLTDLGLSRDYPHHRPQSSNSERRNINVTLCADRRNRTPMHLISTFGNDNMERKKLESLGFSIREAKKNTKNWRFETVYADYGKACLVASKIASVFLDVNIIFRARLGGKKNNQKDGNSLPCLPAGSIMPGMALFSLNGYDIVEKVSKIKTSNTKVYDLDIEKTHNFIANGIVTHNCIYSWRGANLKNILSFEKDYPDAKIILLEQNYRSTQNILEAANVIIKKNKYRPDKNLFTKNDPGEKIGLYEALDENDEADFVAAKILEIKDGRQNVLKRTLGGSDGDGQRKFSAENFSGESENILSSVAILYRANFQSRALEEAMLRYNILYQVLGIKFFERKEIKNTLAYLRVALNKYSLGDMKRIINFPARGIGKVTLVKIFANDIENLPIKMKIKIDNFYKTLEEIKEKIEQAKTSEVIKFVVKKSGIENELSSGTEEDKERLENIKELATLALKYDNLEKGLGIEKLLEDASLASDQDSLIINQPAYSGSFGPLRHSSSEASEAQEKRKEKNSVKLMTVHASKGLEFKCVFITGLEDGLFPHEGKNNEPAFAEGYGAAKEEERRLFYVAVTRAKEKLFLSFTNFRTIFGARNINTPSEFIGDIPVNLLEKEEKKDRIKTIYI